MQELVWARLIWNPVSNEVLSTKQFTNMLLYKQSQNPRIVFFNIMTCLNNSLLSSLLVISSVVTEYFVYSQRDHRLHHTKETAELLLPRLKHRGDRCILGSQVGCDLSIRWRWYTTRLLHCAGVRRHREGQVWRKRIMWTWSQTRLVTKPRCSTLSRSQ